MSAYLVSDKHLSYLASYITARNGDGTARLFINGEYATIENGDDKAAQTIVEVLLKENLRSLAARYPDDNNTVTLPKFKMVTSFDPVQVLKACDCYDYQACETDDYELSEAAGIIDAIRKRAIHNLPGYDNAAWEIK